MQMLKLADDLMPLVQDGSKRVTVRAGRREIVEGPLTLEATNGSVAPIEVLVTRVDICSIRDLMPWAIEGEGLESRFELLEVMWRFYPDIKFDSEVTAIEFEIAA